MSEQLVDRPLRSVFVGNIPYEVTEEKLKEIFSEVGPVLSLKLVYDRDTGKPKGYGFCEYKDVETAMSAMRNLNGYEVNGRVLRVDSAGSMNAGGHSGNSRHDPIESSSSIARDEGTPAPEKAPEVISKAVASLPPEQMFELMKQMKLCIQNNPSEARTMLLQNPQLAYALLQALVVMKIVDPTTALTMVHKDNPAPMGALAPENQLNMLGGNFVGVPTVADNPWIAAAAGMPMMQQNSVAFGAGPAASAVQGNPMSGNDLDLRQLDPRLRAPASSIAAQDFDLRDPRAQSAATDRFMDPRRDRDLRDRDMRDRDMRGDRDLRDPRSISNSDRDMRNDRDLRDPRLFVPTTGATPATASTVSTSNTGMPSDPRTETRRRNQGLAESTTPAAAAAGPTSSSIMAGLGPGATDAERQALIMQVLQLSDEQIAEFPPEQRASILVLKEQIAKSISQNR